MRAKRFALEQRGRAFVIDRYRQRYRYRYRQIHRQVHPGMLIPPSLCLLGRERVVGAERLRAPATEAQRDIDIDIDVDKQIDRCNLVCLYCSPCLLLGRERVVGLERLRARAKRVGAQIQIDRQTDICIDRQINRRILVLLYCPPCVFRERVSGGFGTISRSSPLPKPKSADRTRCGRGRRLQSTRGR